MSLAFLHGEQLLFLGAVTVLVIPAVALWWWRFPPRSPVTPAAIYLSICFTVFVIWLNGSSHGLIPLSGFALALPWSTLYFISSILPEGEVPAWIMLPGIFVNAALIYGAAALAGRRA